MSSGESVTPVNETVDKQESTTERLAKAAHSVIDETAAKAEDVEQRLRTGAEQAGEKMEASQQAATKQVDRTVAQAEAFIHERPIAAAGIAFAAGVLATALLRR